MGWFMVDRCHHQKWTLVQKDGYQYCEQCGKAIAAPPLPQPPACRHKLETIESGVRIVTGSGKNQTQHIQRCTECGRMFVFNSTAGEYNENATP
jgi:hypothetical protein